MAFKKRTAEKVVPSDPEQLYRLLIGGAGAPAALWVHQAEVLRAWSEVFSRSRDVAVELPTGAGKTLVGGLIGEFRRRTAGERVVYVCPTRQLARQIHAKLILYGIPSVLLIGRVATWNAADRARYTSGQAVAVTVYSHVFNSNPAFADAQFLILDDAHGAESAVARPWSIDIPRSSSAYQDVLSVLADALDPLVLARLRTDVPEGQFLSQVYLASPVGLVAAAADLEQVLRTATQNGALGDDVKYALGLMAGHLGRCLVFVSYGALLIRPLIAPTATHTAFDGPSQRLYMGATLGSGGELERSFGRRNIDRIPAPKGWDRQGTGRRFFCFPELTTDLSVDATAANNWIRETIREAGRVIVLTPDRRTASKFISERLPEGMTVVQAGDVEDDLSVFTARPKAALVLTNRYDGVDLPDEDCRPRPRRTVSPATPTACATIPTPPEPNSRASAPNHSRRCRSFKCGLRTSKRLATDSTASGMTRPLPLRTRKRGYFVTSPYRESRILTAMDRVSGLPLSADEFARADRND